MVEINKQNKKLKIFICYSHEDESHIDDFKKHMQPLKDNFPLEDWYDRKILAGEKWEKERDNNLSDADIICLFISKDFLASPNCKKEMEDAFKLQKIKNVLVIPIILKSCLWKEYGELSSILALPQDGKPVLEFESMDDAWCNVCTGLKRVAVNINKIKQLKLTKKFADFLNDVELLTNASSQKENVVLDDIFVYPELLKYDYLGDYEKKESSENIIDTFNESSKILIAGEDQSGKTSLGKKIFLKLRDKNFVPVYIQNKLNPLEGKIENKIIKNLEEQYQNFKINEIDKNKIIPIIDDFHLAKNKERIIRDLAEYTYQIIIVDEIFGLSVIEDEKIRKAFTHYKLNEFKPSLRGELIKKWTQLSDKKDGGVITQNETYHNIDKRTELVDTSLGKIMGSGIMPSYPFFILSIISTSETLERPLNQEITSQGYCYQALITLYLIKHGVKHDELDTYNNFLTEFAFYFFQNKKSSLSKSEFDTFMNIYLEKYNFPMKEGELLKNLHSTKLISFDNFDNILFSYQYIYYFFVAKYLSDHQEEQKESITNIVNNLHKNENAYIAIFMTHHSKKSCIIENILSNASNLFKKYTPATMSKKELSFFDEQTDILVNAVLSDTTPEKERAKRLRTQDITEPIKDKDEKTQEENNDEVIKEFRRSIKTVEVMGQIIKNRHSSLEKEDLKLIFKEAMDVHLRIITSFFELVQERDKQQAILDFMSERLDKIISEKGKKPDKETLEKLSKTIFWNMNLFFMYGVINKIVHSLGSDKLTDKIVCPVCDEMDTPASFLIKQGILLEYNKNLQIPSITKKFKEKQFSEIAKKIMRFQIVNYCAVRSINFADKQRIESQLKIPHNRLNAKKGL